MKFKITISTIILCLLAVGLSSQPTYAFLTDTEESPNGVLSTLTLDADFISDSSDVVPIPGPEEVIICHNVGQNKWQTIAANLNSLQGHLNHGDYLGPCTLTGGGYESNALTVTNIGSIPFSYNQYYQYVSGNEAFCSALDLKIYRETEEPASLYYDGKLASFVGFTPDAAFSNNPLDLAHTYIYNLGLTTVNASNFAGATCQFNIKLEAWQTELLFGTGFFDEETVTLSITASSVAQATSDVVLNEILPNPVGADCDSGNPEWVEIYNKGANTVDLTGWYIKDSANHTEIISAANTLNGDYIFDPNGSGSEWVVVYIDPCWINNTGSEEIFLYDNINNHIDSHEFSLTGSTPENKSIARISDGSANWIDPIPTPGGPNMLEDSVQEEPVVPEVSEPVSEPVSVETEDDSPLQEVQEPEPLLEESGGSQNEPTLPAESEPQQPEESTVLTEPEDEEEVVSELPPVIKPEDQTVSESEAEPEEPNEE